MSIFEGARCLSPPEAQRLVAALLALAGEPGKPAPTRFPGPSPVSVERATLPALAGPEHYWACEKTDGTRALLFCATLEPWGRVCVLVDRALRAAWAPMAAVPSALFQGTLLDGELVQLVQLGNGGQADGHNGHNGHNGHVYGHVFQIFDALAVSGIPVWQTPFSQRLAAVHVGLASYAPAARDALRLRVKKFFGRAHRAALEAHLADLRDPHDGLVFTPESPEVHFGRHMRMFKYKPPGKHTVDFLVDDRAAAGARGETRLLVWDAARQTHVLAGVLCGCRHPPDKLDDAASNGGTPRPSGGTVCECVPCECCTSSAHAAGQGVQAWRLVAARPDKTHANDALTHAKTLQNAREALLCEQVLDAWTGAWTGSAGRAGAGRAGAGLPGAPRELA